MGAADMFDEALEWQEPEPDEGDLDLYRNDGWTYDDILHRRHRIDGQYQGAKP